MKFVIVGCGRVGSTLAENLDRDGHAVLIFDHSASAFDRLPDSFKGVAIRGDGTDEEVLRGGGAEDADIFLSLTEGDNRNIMAAQLAAETLGIPRVIAKINDPVRAEAYSDLGIATLCRTNLMVDSVADFLDLPIVSGPGVSAPTGSHEHHDERAGHVTASPPVVRPPARGNGRPEPGAGFEADARPPLDAPPGDGGQQAPEAGARTARRDTRGFRRWRG